MYRSYILKSNNDEKLKVGIVGETKIVDCRN